MAESEVFHAIIVEIQCTRISTISMWRHRLLMESSSKNANTTDLFQNLIENDAFTKTTWHHPGLCFGLVSEGREEISEEKGDNNFTRRLVKSSFPQKFVIDYLDEWLYSVSQ